MAKSRPAAGGGRWVEVQPERVAKWLAGFAERHGGVKTADLRPDLVRFHGEDGDSAECHVPFPPLRADAAGATPFEEAVQVLAAHAGRDRRVGVLLVRLGGYAAGVFEGRRLTASKVGSRLVHGRSAAGGQSQQRFARRREKQAREALRAAADVAARILAPEADGLDAVVLGGDRHAIDGLRGDPRLASVFARAAGPFLDVPDPRLAVLEAAPERFRAVRIRLTA